MNESFDVAAAVEQRNILIAFLINSAETKLPIKASEMLEILNKNNKMYNHCFQMAKEALKLTYDLTVQQVMDEKKAGKKYICYSGAAKSIFEYDQEQQRHLTLLFVILSFIFMTGRPVYDDELEGFLKGLKIYFDEEHQFFGANLKKLITETFVKQLYLKREKSDSELDTEIKYVYSWGFRAYVEFREKEVLNATAKILGKRPDFFVAQYSRLYENDEIEDPNDAE